MSKKPRKKPSKSGRNKTAPQAPKDFWDLGDDDLDTNKPETTETRPALKKEKAKKTSSPKTEVVSKNNESDFPDGPEDEIGDEIEKKVPADEPTKPQTEPKLPKKTEGRTREAPKDTTPVSIFEKISLLIVVACLIGAMAWGISTFLSQAPQGEIIAFKDEYPAKGQNLTIESVETWWRKPLRKGENADIGVIIQAKLIPCASITLSEGQSTTLRVSFRDGEKELIGDTINLLVQDGKFARSGSNQIEIFSTAGFTNPSAINSYANEDIPPWSMTITEGDIGDDNEPLVKARISATTRAQ